MAPLRADARRNRERIIAAAKVAFAEAGLDVSMDAIAREAGVGIGTLYRRFQDRDELIVAVAAHTFRAVLVDARAAVGAEPSAWDAFVRLVMRSDELRLAVHLAFQSPQVWKTVHHAPESRDVHREMIAVLDRLVEAARNEGSIRADIGSGDALSLVSLVLGSRPPASDPAGRMQTERAVWIVLDGLRAKPGFALPGAPVTMQELDARSERRTDATDG